MRSVVDGEGEGEVDEYAECEGEADMDADVKADAETDVDVDEDVNADVEVDSTATKHSGRLGLFTHTCHNQYKNMSFQNISRSYKPHDKHIHMLAYKQKSFQVATHILALNRCQMYIS